MVLWYLVPFTFGQGGYGLILVAIGSLLPDIDLRSSTLGRWNPLSRFMKHRGRCHSIIGVLFISTPFMLFGGWPAYVCVLIGAYGHLAADKAFSWLPRRKPFPLRFW